MSRLPGGDRGQFPDRVDARAGADIGTRSGVRVDVSGQDRSQQAALGSGTQHNYFTGTGQEAEASVSIAPPAGLRDRRYPLRGRETLLGDILSADGGRGVRVVHGMGGCGKTSLALEAAHDAVQRGWQVWWVSAADRSGFLGGMRALSRRLGLTDDELRYGDAADLLWQRLSRQDHKWLLVIDNADDPQVTAGPGQQAGDGTGWLRPVTSGAGLIVVTSRDGRAESWGPWCRLYRLGMLTSEEAVQVLADRTGIHHDALGGDAGAEALADRLGRLPLALRIAGSFLAELAEVPPAFAGPAPLRSYLQYLDTLKRGDLPAAFPSPVPGALTPSQARGIIGRTWDLTLSQLEYRDFPEVRGLLRLLACLADAPVPYELLHPPILASSPLFPGITGPRLWQVLKALAGSGLIEVTGSPGQAAPGVITLHPLVRDTSRAGLPPGQRPDYISLAARLTAAAAAPETAGSPEDPLSWPRWHALAPHALHIFETMITADSYPDDAVLPAAYAADKAASYQATQGLISPAEATHRTLLQIRLRTLGADHPDTLGTRHSIARRLSERADYQQAETEYRTILKAMRRVLGPEHPDTLTVQHNIASLTSFRGDYARAEADYRDVLEIKLRVFGQDHPDTLITRHEIARMMNEQGRHAEAETEFRDILTARLKARPPDHYHTLITRSQLARAMAAQGQHSSAERELRDILAEQLNLLGPDHLRTLWTRQRIALVMAAQGDYTAAENELRDVLAKRQARVPDHPDTLAARHDLAKILAAHSNQTPAITETQDAKAAKNHIRAAHPSADPVTGDTNTAANTPDTRLRTRDTG